MRRGVLFLSAIFLILFPGVSYATQAELDEATLEKFQINNINYYNPCGGASTSSSAGKTGLALGDTGEAQVWNYFATADIDGLSDNPAAIAGILGNMSMESGYDPFVENGSHFGLAGFDYNGQHKTYLDLYQKLVDKGWGGYVHFPKWNGGHDSTAPPDVETEARQIELEYLVETGNFKNFMKNLDKVSEKTPPAYAELFMVEFERAVGTDQTGDGYLTDPGVISHASSTAFQGMNKRREASKKIYEKYASSGSSMTPSSSSDSRTAKEKSDDLKDSIKNFRGNSNRASSATTSSDGWIGGIEGLQRESALGRSDLKETPQDEFATDNKKPNMIILHYTAGSENKGLATYGENMFPAHFTVDLEKKTGYQHFPLSRPSLAVVDYDGYAIQIEIVGFYKTWGGAKSGSTPNLADLDDEAWDYLAYYLNAISHYTGIPLTSTVTWPEKESGVPGARLTDAEAKSYRGILGHMHLPNNPGKVDPGNIWSQVEAAIQRSGGATGTYDDLCSATTTGIGGVISGGMTLEQAKQIVKPFSVAEHGNAGAFASKWKIATVGTCVGPGGDVGSAITNCVSFSQYFINRYTKYYRESVDQGGNGCNPTGDGLAVVNSLLLRSKSNGFTKGGHTPRPYSVFSIGLGSNHTGIVLNVDEEKGTMIIAEAGYCSGKAFTGAKEVSLTTYSGPAYTYAYMESEILFDELQKTVQTGE